MNAVKADSLLENHATFSYNIDVSNYSDIRRNKMYVAKLSSLIFAIAFSGSNFSAYIPPMCESSIKPYIQDKGNNAKWNIITTDSNKVIYNNGQEKQVYYIDDHSYNVSTNAFANKKVCGKEIVGILSLGDNTANLKVINEGDMEYVMKSENLSRLQKMKEFENNWNGYGAKTFSHSLIEKCINIINQIKAQPILTPTGRGSIQIEYNFDDGRYLEFEVFEDLIYIFRIDKDGSETTSQVTFDENAIFYINKEITNLQ